MFLETPGILYLKAHWMIQKLLSSFSLKQFHFLLILEFLLKPYHNIPDYPSYQNVPNILSPPDYFTCAKIPRQCQYNSIIKNRPCAAARGRGYLHLYYSVADVAYHWKVMGDQQDRQVSFFLQFAEEVDDLRLG